MRCVVDCEILRRLEVQVETLFIFHSHQHGDGITHGSFTHVASYHIEDYTTTIAEWHL